MDTQQQLADHLQKKGILKSPPIIKAFENIDRKDFMLKQYEYLAYIDQAVGIGHGAAISQPSTVAIMLERLGPKQGDKILDVGAGSGRTSTMFGQIVGQKGQVIGTEIISELVEFGNKNVQKYNMQNVEIKKVESEIGYKSQAPYDKILVSAAAQKLPEKLLNQLKINGKLVIPVQNSIYEIKKDENANIHSKQHYGFAFVPLIGG